MHGWWGKVNETLLSDKKDFYSHLSMESITAACYMNDKGIYKDIQTKKIWVNIIITWIAGKNSMKYYYQRKQIFTIT